ncbi:MAG: hypothetical protein ABI162_18865 [Luteolibacter sp.]
MNPSLIDPNNHAPEVSPNDGWDDADGFGANGNATPVVLPPRRTVAERAAADPSENLTVGFRIEPNVARRETGDDVSRLEVQEISGSVLRLEQTEPAPPKVVRSVVFHERLPEEKRPSEGRDWGSAQKFSLRWILGTSVGVTALIILPLVLLPMINKSNAARTPSPDRVTKVIEEEKIEGMDAVNLLQSKQPEAEQIFSAYVKAQVSGEVLALLANADSVSENVRKNWHPQGVSNSWTPGKETTWQINKVNKHLYGILAGTLPDFSNFSAYFLNKDNHLLLDWKATSVFGTATFEELSKGQGDASEIRGLIQPSNFYTTTWPETEYNSFQFIGPAGVTSIWCYTKRNDPSDAALAEVFQAGEILNEAKSSQRVTLRLEHGAPGALPNQWLIGEMLHIEWITP